MDIKEKNGLHYLEIKGTKTAAAHRKVPLPDVLYNKVRNVSPFDYLAQNKMNKPFTKQGYFRLVKRLKREMNIELGCRVYRNEIIPPFPLADDFTPYMLRHTYCTDLQKKGIDIRVAQKLMGHADIKVTANIYTHQDDVVLEAAAKVLCNAQSNTHSNTPPDKARKTANE